MRETIIADAGWMTEIQPQPVRKTSRLKPLPQFLINLASGSVAAKAAPTVLNQPCLRFRRG